MDNRNNNLSSAFGEYSKNKKGNSIPEPQNISSDMWTPISTGSQSQKNLQNTNKQQAPKKQTTAQKTPQKKKQQQAQSNRPISEGRANQQTSNKKTAQKKSQPNKQSKAKPQNKKARVPKGKPVSELLHKQDEAIKRQSLQQEKIKRQQELNRHSRDYDKQLKKGKSHNEISKQRADAKRKRRRIRNIIAVILFFTFVCAFIGVYTYSKGAPIVNLSVEGESIYKNEEILSAAEIEIGLNMLSLREKSVNKKVTTELPYIHSVELDRKLPDTLTVTVTPTKEKYLIVNDKGYICVNEHGKILSLKKKKLKEGMFRIYGFEVQECEAGTEYIPSEVNAAKYELVKNIVSLLEAEGVVDRASINLTDMSDAFINFDSRIRIYLGDCSEIDKQIKLACNVIKSSASDGQTGYIDMRYSDMAFFNEGTMDID